MLRGMKSFGREKHGSLGAVPIHTHVGRFPILMELREVGRAADDRQSSGQISAHTPGKMGACLSCGFFAPLRKCWRLFAAGVRLSMLSTCPRLRFWFNFSENSAVSPNVLNGRKQSRY